jgi:hypothetical protein
MSNSKKENVVKPTFDEGYQRSTVGQILHFQPGEVGETREDIRKRRYCLKWEKRYRLESKIKTFIAWVIAVVAALTIGSNVTYLLETYSSSSIFNIIIGLEISAVIYMLVYFSALDYYPNDDFRISIEAAKKYDKKLKSRNRDELI